MNALGAARYIERAGAVAVALGVAVVMSAEPAAHAGRGLRAAIAPGGIALLPPVTLAVSVVPSPQSICAV